MGRRPPSPPPVAPEREAAIPSAMDDWDRAFERATGIHVPAAVRRMTTRACPTIGHPHVFALGDDHCVCCGAPAPWAPVPRPAPPCRDADTPIEHDPA